MKKKQKGMPLDTMGKRIKYWRKEILKETILKLCEKIHISCGSISDLENDLSKPSANTLANMHYAGADIIWILTGIPGNPDDFIY